MDCLIIDYHKVKYDKTKLKQERPKNRERHNERKYRV